MHVYVITWIQYQANSGVAKTCTSNRKPILMYLSLLTIVVHPLKLYLNTPVDRNRAAHLTDSPTNWNGYKWKYVLQKT